MEESSTSLLDTDAALEPFLKLVQESSGNASTVNAVIPKILSHSDIFCGFDQIKQLIPEASPLIQTTLDLFSYGSYSDYIADTSKFIPLNDAQIMKLRQLTVLAHVQEACSSSSSNNTVVLGYATLASALSLSEKDVEKVIIRCLYARILNGRLCQKSKQLLLQTSPPCISRDVPLSSLPTLLTRWQGLHDRLQGAQSTLQSSHGPIEEKLQEIATYRKEVQARQQKAAAAVSSNRWPDSRRSTAASRQSKRSRAALAGTYVDPPLGG